MKKILSLLLLVVLLSSCEKNVYTVEITNCVSGKKDTIVGVDYTYPYIETYKEAIPVLRIGNRKYLNICELNVLKVRTYEEGLE